VVLALTASFALFLYISSCLVMKLKQYNYGLQRKNDLQMKNILHSGTLLNSLCAQTEAMFGPILTTIYYVNLVVLSSGICLRVCLK
jgi:hypothetical protein